MEISCKSSLCHSHESAIFASRPIEESLSIAVWASWASQLSEKLFSTKFHCEAATNWNASAILNLVFQLSVADDRYLQMKIRHMLGLVGVCVQPFNTITIG